MSTASSAKPGWTLASGANAGDIVLTGEIDFTATPAVREQLLAAIESGPSEIVLHLAGLDYVDSSGLALFIEAKKRLAEAGRTIRIADISPQVAKIFHLTQLGELFGLPE
ncbi:MAG: anti-anti-sigma factor [Solidesulfovibrio magneticus str. Maddingley MBC34]|uniref:Anti-sigma factor antagonist n=1 Tax=Solidesulfovibrio magneticus str. Maddingley MBC34 TaxID=1206767 RepID=K6HAN7_9BACT|nr:MAG: anti-anti-sigma factor [Solidesulfovibrio magneticus str. Maddingley MBC34]